MKRVVFVILNFKKFLFFNIISFDFNTLGPVFLQHQYFFPVVGVWRRRWEDYIRMDMEEIGINAGNWVDSAQDRDYWRALVNAALNLQVP